MHTDALGTSRPTLSTLDPVERAGRHPLAYDRPAPDFFEGALLGNGGLGVVVTTRPDAVVLHFGHNNVWDIRLAEHNTEQLGTFEELFARIQAIPHDYASLDEDPWFRDYCEMARENYAKPYPRPMPCGSLLLGFDRRHAEVLGHRVDIATGLCAVHLLAAGQPVTLQVFVEPNHDRVWLHLIDRNGRPANLPFERIRLVPDPDTPPEFPPCDMDVDAAGHVLSLRQVLPWSEERQPDHPPHPKDRAFRLTAAVTGTIARAGGQVDTTTRANGVSPFGEQLRGWQDDEFALQLIPVPAFVACVQLEEGLASTIPTGADETPAPDEAAFEAALIDCRDRWREYWSRSGVALDDTFLERLWYHNLYFFDCAVKPGANCPGLFANWSYRAIGSAWHGDYHLNYNTQQPFWVTFSSNHVDKHLAYVGMLEQVLPLSQRWARDYYGLRGAYFPHSAYPVEMSTMPYPVPTWGWEICETPWAVQSLWWHYLYTLDQDFLRERALPLLREAVRFLVDYMQRPAAHGPQWGDDRYHIFPTVPPELYGLTPGFRKNYDCLVDLTLTKFVFNAYLRACAMLELESEEAELVSAVHDILQHFPAYATAESQHGTVFVSVPGEDPEVVYNTPNSIMTVFPGEDHGLHSPPEQYALAVNSYRNHRNEGGNELVFYHLAGARLGILDLERFKRQVAYCLLPNGTCTDKVLQVGGRYNDSLPYDFMARMGVWFENFALPVVVNECLLQSYTGVLRFFPNWPADKRAEFRTLRAVGGFLVSAAWQDGEVQWIEVVSEAGAPLRFYVPWQNGARCIRTSGEQILTGKVGDIQTEPGEVLRLQRYTGTSG